MNLDELSIAFSYDDNGPVIEVGSERVATLPDLIRAVPALKESGQLAEYCEAVNHLKHGSEFRLILDPDAYRANYQRRLTSENPQEPWQEGVPRLCDFGVCDTEEISAPHAEAGSVIFYVEDDYLGIPYRVEAPATDRPEGEVTYLPLPMNPFPE